MHVGSTLKLLRIDAGMSLRALARRVGVSSAYLSRVENGRDPAPTPDRLAAIADALQIPADVLVELAHQTGPALTEYIERVPAASAFFLEVARRNLDATQLARLREVMDAELSRPDPEPPTAGTLSALVGSRVILALECTGMDEIIDAGAARCVRGSGARAANVARQIREREATAPTAVGMGVAVPHAIVPGSPSTVTVVVPSSPLDLPAPDGKPIGAAFVLLSGAAGRAHLEILARIARLASHGIAAELRAAATTRQAIAAIERLEAL